MNESEKNLFVNTLKQSFRFNYPKGTADEMCDRLDKAKDRADIFERIYNMHQQQWQQFMKDFTNLFLTKNN